MDARRRGVADLFAWSAAEIKGEADREAFCELARGVIAGVRHRLLDTSRTAALIDAGAPWPELAKAARSEGYIALAQDVERAIQLGSPSQANPEATHLFTLT